MKTGRTSTFGYRNISRKVSTMKSIKASFSMPALLAALLAGGSILAATAYALPTGGTDGKPRCEARQGLTPQAREARHVQHLAALKEKLKLAPRQEAAWNAFAATMQPGMRPAVADRQAMRAEFGKLGTVERMDRMAAMAEARHAHMTERAAAFKAFYAQLTPEQQKVFDAEAIPQFQHRGHHHGRQA
jgi:Spy/CpxP family protein refolding chaperone